MGRGEQTLDVCQRQSQEDGLDVSFIKEKQTGQFGRSTRSLAEIKMKR